MLGISAKFGRGESASVNSVLPDKNFLSITHIPLRTKGITELFRAIVNYGDNPTFGLVRGRGAI